LIIFSQEGKRREGRLVYLFILELNQIFVVLDNFIALVLTLLEQLWERKPLTSHFISLLEEQKRNASVNHIGI